MLVVILDGFGENEFKDEFNAVHVANTPVVDALRAVPGRFRTVKAHGRAVGLPSDADMGNSEVGHNALGAGQVVDQGARLVDIALETGKMFEGDGWKLISQAFADHTLHFIGLLSDGGVHSRYDQLIGTLKVRGPLGVRQQPGTSLRDQHSIIGLVGWPIAGGGGRLRVGHGVLPCSHGVQPCALLLPLLCHV